MEPFPAAAAAFPARAGLRAEVAQGRGADFHSAVGHGNVTHGSPSPSSTVETTSLYRHRLIFTDRLCWLSTIFFFGSCVKLVS